MTTVAVLVDPPRPGLVLPRLVRTSPLDEDEAARLYEGMLLDVVVAVTGSGGDLLINYRPDDALPADHRTGGDVTAELTDVVESVAPDARFEPQVGETFAGRAGNTVTHLLEREGVQTVAIVEPTAAFLTRTEIDGAAMKLRRHGVVLGPAPGGRVSYAGFAAPIDFTDAYEPPALETLTERAVAADLQVDFLPLILSIETGRDLATALSVLAARRAAGAPVPERTAQTLADLGLTAVPCDGDLAAVRRTEGP